MNDRPTAAELVSAARQHLERELLPTIADARLRFQTLVAANVLAIVERELVGEEAELLEEWEWLAQRLDLTGSVPQRLTALRKSVRDAHEELCRRIRAGDFDEKSRFQTLSDELRHSVERKLEVSNPRYLADFRGQAKPTR